MMLPLGPNCKATAVIQIGGSSIALVVPTVSTDSGGWNERSAFLSCDASYRGVLNKREHPAP